MRAQTFHFGLFLLLQVIPQLIDASTLKREVIEGVDIMVVRELTGGIYFGTPKGIETDSVTGVRKGYRCTCHLSYTPYSTVICPV